MFKKWMVQSECILLIKLKTDGEGEVLKNLFYLLPILT